MKPVRPDRLAEAVRRVVDGGRERPRPRHRCRARTRPSRSNWGASPASSPSQIRYAQAQGDYARLHTESGSHLVRIPLSTLEERWGTAGFVRIHRSTLVALPGAGGADGHGRCTVVLDGAELQVSRPAYPQAARPPAARAQAVGPMTPGSPRTPGADCPAGPRPGHQPRRDAATRRDLRPHPRHRRADRPRGGLHSGAHVGPAARPARARVRRRARRPAAALPPRPRHPHARDRQRAPWLVLGVLVYPIAILVARYYVRQSERIEREFSQVVGRT